MNLSRRELPEFRANGRPHMVEARVGIEPAYTALQAAA
jgi:hypothetical protein